MSQRRRRADDFTDSLNSFQNVTETTNNSNTHYSISQDSLDECKSVSNHVSDYRNHSAKHSIILSGNSTKHLYKEDLSISSVMIYPSTMSKPDLNKRIDSVETEQQCDKIHNHDKYDNSQCSLKNEQLESNAQPVSHNRSKNNMKNQSSKKDSNYNVYINKSDVKCTNEEDYVNNEVNKFETLLCSLDNQLNKLKETSKSQVLKRLSNQFMNSPQHFTEKLLTIIEESVVNNDSDTYNTSALNLSRLTMEFRKMCKFIEDESAPEWVLSPPSISQCPKQALTSPVCDKLNHANTPKIETLLTSPINMSTPITPISGVDVMRRRFFNKISKNNCSGSADSVVNISGSESSITSFERLEAQCKKLFPEEMDQSKLLRKSLSAPTLLNMNQINDICEEQMALLNVSDPIDQTHRKNVSSPNLSYKCQNSKKLEFDFSDLQLEANNKLKNVQHDKVSYSKKRSIKLSEKSDISKTQSDKTTSGYVIVDPDELEKTLLQDIAEKRKRCLDTARLITEINADPTALEAQKSLRMSPMFADDNESDSLTIDEAKFLKTLMSCKDYQSYLEKQKPLFKLLQDSNTSISNITHENNVTPDLKYTTPDAKKGNFNVKKSSPKGSTCSTNMKSYSPYKLLPKEKSNEKETKKENIKPKLFVTPGKTPPSQKCKRKKTYFPPLSPAKIAMERHILKSPHAEGLYRLNYNTIISPVGMYIRGTDMQLIKNVRAKRDDLLLTPVRKNHKPLPNKNLKQSTPLKERNETCEKPTLKITLSPKVGANDTHTPRAIAANTPENYDTPKSHFVLPKVSYKLPLQVKTIKESNSPKSGTRVKKLLECAQSKVVIRHQARVNTVQKRQNTPHDGVYEIHYEPENESVHIEQAANKTNFIGKRKNA